MSKINGYIAIDQLKSFLFSEKEYVYYLVSLHLHKNYLTKLNVCLTDDRFVEVKDLKIILHTNTFHAIEYTVVFGFGVKLPKIYSL